MIYQDFSRIVNENVYDYNDEIFDQNADYNNSSYTFTAPVTGKYHLNARVRFTNLDTGAGYYYLGIITSNREYYNIVPTQFASDVSYYTAIVSELVDMDASDTAYCVVYQEASGTSGQTDIQGGSTFGGFLACQPRVKQLNHKGDKNGKSRKENNINRFTTKDSV